MKNPVRLLVSSKKKAKLFSYDKENGFHLMQVYTDEPWEQEAQFTDRAGRGHSSKTGTQYAVNNDSSQKEDLRHHFMHHVCERLNKDWETTHFNYLCLFAESKALGDLRSYMPKALQKIVTYEAPLNLVEEHDDKIIEHFKKISVSEMIKTVL